MHLSESAAKKKLRVVIIKPSKYDDEGYVIRHFRGVLPSNTLACLSSLTHDVAEHGELGKDYKLELVLYDDTVEKIPVRKIIASHRLPECRTVIALAGVQSNQFPRAADLARKFRNSGLQVLVGGFHVSGTLALSPVVTHEIQELLDIGVLSRVRLKKPGEIYCRMPLKTISNLCTISWTRNRTSAINPFP